MRTINNHKTIQNLAKKSFWANKTRNKIAMIAIALTAILFTSLFTMGIGTMEALQKATIRQSGCAGHGVLKYITNEQFDAVKNHPLIKEIAYNQILADSVDNDELIKRRTEFWYYDDVGLKLGFCEPTTGTRPIKENEIISDTKTLQLLGIPLKIGSPVTLKLNVKGEELARNFVLSGWWESDPGFNVGQIFTSRSYADAHSDELQNTYKSNHYLSGCIQTYIMFSNSMNLERKLAEVITDSGFSTIEADDNFIESNVNWAYLSTNFNLDAGTVISLSLGLLLIIFTGYLIIYNIFQISIIKDIRFYGLLKTIGTTGKQLRHIINWQAMQLCIIGIPIGLFLGYFSGKALVPLLMSNSTYAETTVTVSPNPFIFVGAGIFSLLTVLISTRKPGKIAASVSPIEAIRYSDNSSVHSTNTKKSTKGGKVSRMAFANLGRNQKRTALVVISLSLSIILLNTVVTLSDSIDINKFLGKFVDTDFLIAHADYFNYRYNNNENETSESFINTVKSLEGFEEGGRLYSNFSEQFTVTDKSNSQTINHNDKGDFFAACYGLEDLPFCRLELLDGEIDKDKLLSGKYILEGIQLDDNSRPLMETAKFKIGEKVILHNYKGLSEDWNDREYTTYEFTVIGHVAIKYYTNSSRVNFPYTFYLPAETYKPLVAQPAVMSYAFNIRDDKEAETETFLKSYTDKTEPLMNYDSKFTTMSSFAGTRNTLLLVGGALGVLIGIIGILNFINAILTSIVTRRKEFAMLQSIGMTSTQLRKMLCLEGIFYTFFTALTVFILGITCSLVIVKALCGQLWFMSYHFLLWPLIISIPILLLLGVVIPLTTFRLTGKQSIVERLRDTE